MIYLVGFNIDEMEEHANYFDKNVYLDRTIAIEENSEQEAIERFLEYRWTWIREEEKQFVTVLDVCDKKTWEDIFYCNENRWLRKLGMR